MLTRQPSPEETTFSRIELLEAQDITPYPASFERSCCLIDVQQDFSHVAPGQDGEDVDLLLCGRVVRISVAEDVVWIDVEDRETALQFALEKSELGQRGLQDAITNVRRGDYVGFNVYRVGRTPSGELTAFAYHWIMLAPCLLPSAHAAITDLQPSASRTARRRLALRSKIVRITRRYLEDQRDFLEVTATAALTSACRSAEYGIHSAEAIHLQKLVGAGLEAVYTLTTAATAGSSEPTETLHACMAPADHTDMMQLAERLIRTLAIEIQGRTALPCYRNAPDYAPMSDDEAPTIDLKTPWQRRSVYELAEEVTGIAFHRLTSPDDALEAALISGVTFDPAALPLTVGSLALAILEQRAAPTLMQPTFVIDYPGDAHTFSRRHRYDPQLEQFARLYIHGLEFATVYTVLTDPREAEAQLAGHAARSEARTYLTALRYGLPPSGGLTLSVDRLSLLLGGPYAGDLARDPANGRDF